MAQQRSRKVVRVVLAAGAPIVAAVLGVSLGWAGGSARADNGQPIILGAAAACGGTGTNCESSTTQIENTGIGPVVQAFAEDSSVALYGQNDTNAPTVGGASAIWGNGVGAGDDGVIGSGDANGVHGVTSNGAASGVFGDNRSGGNGVYGHANNSAASGVYGQNDGTGFGVAGRAAGGLASSGTAPTAPGCGPAAKTP